MYSISTFWEDSITCFTEEVGGKLCGAIALGTISGLLLLLAHSALAYERCRYQAEYERDATTSLYCLLGNLCSTIGAILSRQLHLQVILAAFSATIDAVSFLTLCIPICLCRNSKAGLRMRARQRRQHLYGICVLFMITGGFLKVGQSNSEIHKTLRQRRLLQIIMEDNSDIVGYVLGILSLVIAYTSRFPALYRTCTKRLMTRAQLFSAMLCCLAGTCYATALLFYDTSNAFIWRTLPWLLSGVLCAIMDLLIILIHLCKNLNPVVLSPDTVSLLGKSTIAVKEKANEERIHSPQIKKNPEKLTGTDCYLHVNCPSHRKSPIQLHLSRTVKTEGVQNKDEECFCSSDTSFDSSVISSDLEWDFEEANIQWREQAAVKLNVDKFPLQEWQSISLTN